MWKIQGHTEFSGVWRLFRRGSTQQKGKLGKPTPAPGRTARSQEAQCPTTLGPHIIREGWLRLRQGTCSHMLAKAWGVFSSHTGVDLEQLSASWNLRSGVFFVYSPRGWRVQLLFPIFGGTPLASLPCASTGTCVHARQAPSLHLVKHPSMTEGQTRMCEGCSTSPGAVIATTL